MHQTDKKNNKTIKNPNGFSVAIVLILVSIILFGISLYIRIPNQKFFADTMTGRLSANILFADYPESSGLFFTLIKDLLNRFLWAYIIPTIIFIISICLFVAGFMGILRKQGNKRKKGEKYTAGKEIDKTTILENKSDIGNKKTHSEEDTPLTPFIKPSQKRYIPVILLLLFLIALIISRYALFDKIIYTSDEFICYYQAKIFKNFKAYINAPYPPDSYAGYGIVNKDGKYFGKYTPGYPILLVPFAIIRNPYIANPIFAVLTILVIFFIGREIYDRKTGIIAGLLLAVSPFFIFNSFTVSVHIPFLLFYALFVLFYVKTVKYNQLLNPLFAGISLGFAFLIRPSDAILPTVLFILSSIYFVFKGGWEWRNNENENKNDDKEKEENTTSAPPSSPTTKPSLSEVPDHHTNIPGNKKELILRFIIIGSMTLIFIGILLWFNRIWTGDCFTFGFQAYDPDEKWGMGVMGHNFRRGLWNTALSTMRLAIWLPPLTILLSIISLFERDRRSIFLFLLFLCPVVFYFFYYCTGLHEFGPRFYFSSLLPLPLLAARGIISQIHKRVVRGNYPWLPTAFIVLYTVICCIPGIARESVKYPLGLTSFFRIVDERFKDEPGGTIVFLQATPNQYANYYIRNSPFLDDKNITVYFLDPKINERVIKKFPGKKPYLANYDDQSMKWSFTPYYSDNYENLPPNERLRIRVISALNYAMSMRKYQEAIDQLDKALEISPDNPDILFIKGVVYNRAKEYEKAQKCWEDALKIKPSLSEAYFSLGLLYAKRGMKDESVKYFEKYLFINPQTMNARKAREWIRIQQKQRKSEDG